MTNQVNIKKLAAILQITPRRADQYAQAGVFVMKDATGLYDVAECAVAYALRLKRHAGSEVLPCTIEEVGRCINLGKSRVSVLEKAGVFKKLSHGRYDLLESVRGYIQHIEKRHEARLNRIRRVVGPVSNRNGS